MVESPQIFLANVMHQRLFPQRNGFNYGIYYLMLPLPAAAIGNRLCRFDPSDLALRDGSDPLVWVKNNLATQGLTADIEHIVLMTMPKVLGYVFNPVSFYFCFDRTRHLKAVLCEVHNTFGEQHSYLCFHADGAPILPTQWLEAVKLFHVSPFLQRNGHYKFRFDLQDSQIGIWIDYYDQQGQRQLVTALTGQCVALTPRSLQKAFWKHPLVSLKAIFLIHWQALKLIFKGIRHISKPEQVEKRLSTTNDLNKP